LWHPNYLYVVLCLVVYFNKEEYQIGVYLIKGILDYVIQMNDELILWVINCCWEIMNIYMHAFMIKKDIELYLFDKAGY
jgi:hypothetical protein